MEQGRSNGAAVDPGEQREVGPACPHCERPIARREREGSGAFVKARGVVVRDGAIYATCHHCGDEYNLTELAGRIRLAFPSRTGS